MEDCPPVPAAPSSSSPELLHAPKPQSNAAANALRARKDHRETNISSP
jgi:hypothetical protein